MATQSLNLGKQVPANVIIDKAVEVGATAIGPECAARVHLKANAVDRE